MNFHQKNGNLQSALCESQTQRIIKKINCVKSDSLNDSLYSYSTKGTHYVTFIRNERRNYKCLARCEITFNVKVDTLMKLVRNRITVSPIELKPSRSFVTKINRSEAGTRKLKSDRKCTGSLEATRTIFLRESLYPWEESVICNVIVI